MHYGPTHEMIDRLADDFNVRRAAEGDKYTFAERTRDTLVVKTEDGKVFVFRLDEEWSILGGESEDVTLPNTRGGYDQD